MYALKKSEDYMNETPIEIRKELGQYFTNNIIKERLMANIQLFNGAKVLEPSVGTGEFIESLLTAKETIEVDAVEITEALANHVRSEYSELMDISVYNTDFLEFKNPKQYDFIIGNPPYFNIKLEKEMKKEYSEVIKGRVDIYQLFIYKCINMLKEDGVLAFVVPPSMNTGAYFSKLRQFIVANCDIQHMEYFDTKQFKGAQQDVQIIVLKKTTNTGKYVLGSGIDVSFNPNAEEAKELFKGSTTLNKLGFKVETGQVIWNEHKEKLVDDKGTLLVWGNNINAKNELVVKVQKTGTAATKDKGQFLNDVGGFKLLQEGIVCKRTVGASKKLNFALITNPFVAENHINVITNVGGEMSLSELYEKLSDERTQSAIKYITGNNQLSQKELQEKLPIFI